MLLPPLALGTDEGRTLAEITVSAGGDLAEQRAAATRKMVIGAAEIESLGGITVGEVLRKLPGMEIGLSGGDGAGTAKARGMSRDAVQILVDGERPSPNARFALATVGRMGAGELERIEILRGASAEYGGSAPVTVNLVMKKARPKTSASLKLTAGARGEEGNGQVNLSRGGGEGGFSWLFPVTVNHHAVPVDRQLSRQNASAGNRNLWQEERERSVATVDEVILSPRFTWKQGGDSLTLSPSYYHNDGARRLDLQRSAYADPAAGTGLAAEDGRSDREESGTRIARLRAEGQVTGTGGARLSGRFTVMDGRRHVDNRRTARDAAGVVTATGESLRRDESELSGALRFDRAVDEHFISAGLERIGHWRDEDQAYGSAFSRHAARESQWTAWVQDEWNPLAALTLTAGLRGETLALETGGWERRHGLLAPSLALRWEAVEGWVLRSAAGAGIKAPRLDELSGAGTRSAGINSPLEPDRAGNPDLRPERNVNLEAGLERYLPSEAGVLGASVYLRHTTDFIERRTRLEGGRWVDRPGNEGDARHWGLELDARLRTDFLPLPGGSLRAHLTLPRSRVEDTRLRVPRTARDAPRYIASLGYEQSLPRWSASFGFQVQKSGRSRSHIPGELQDEAPGRTLLDAYVLHRLSPALNLRLSAQNLLAADIRRTARAEAGADNWQLATNDVGQRTWLLSLEGKW